MAFVAAYAKFLLDLPSRTRVLFISSGILFVTGAIGFELIGGWYADKHGTGNITYALITTCEELLEMLGIALFIYTLLKYIVDTFGSLSLSVFRNSENTV